MIQLQDKYYNKNLTGDIIAYLHTLNELCKIPKFKIADCFTVAGVSKFPDAVKSHFLRQLASLPIKLEMLNKDELTVINEIRDFVSKPPKKRICGSLPIEMDSTTLEVYKLNDPNKVRLELRVLIPLKSDCKLNHIIAVIRKDKDSPIIATKRLRYLGLLNNKVAYSNAKLLLNSAPTGSYLFELSFNDQNDNALYRITKTHSFD